MKTAADGYFLAKREVQKALINRSLEYEEKMNKAALEGDVNKHIAAKSAVMALEEFRDFVRNVMLWDTRNN